jgi:hypothetical protein
LAKKLLFDKGQKSSRRNINGVNGEAHALIKTDPLVQKEARTWMESRKADIFVTLKDFRKRTRECLQKLHTSIEDMDGSIISIAFVGGAPIFLQSGKHANAVDQFCKSKKIDFSRLYEVAEFDRTCNEFGACFSHKTTKSKLSALEIKRKEVKNWIKNQFLAKKPDLQIVPWHSLEAKNVIG